MIRKKKGIFISECNILEHRLQIHEVHVAPSVWHVQGARSPRSPGLPQTSISRFGSGDSLSLPPSFSFTPWGLSFLLGCSYGSSHLSDHLRTPRKLLDKVWKLGAARGIFFFFKFCWGIFVPTFGAMLEKYFGYRKRRRRVCALPNYIMNNWTNCNKTCREEIVEWTSRTDELLESTQMKMSATAILK